MECIVSLWPTKIIVCKRITAEQKSKHYDIVNLLKPGGAYIYLGVVLDTDLLSVSL